MGNNHQIFTVFGGSFVAETRQADPAPRRRKDRSFGPLAMLLVATLVGATIPAVAVTASNHIRATESARWKQPAYFQRMPPAVGIEQAVY